MWAWSFPYRKVENYLYILFQIYICCYVSFGKVNFLGFYPFHLNFDMLAYMFLIFFYLPLLSVGHIMMSLFSYLILVIFTFFILDQSSWDWSILIIFCFIFQKTCFWFVGLLYCKYVFYLVNSASAIICNIFIFIFPSHIIWCSYIIVFWGWYLDHEV